MLIVDILIYWILTKIFPEEKVGNQRRDPESNENWVIVEDIEGKTEKKNTGKEHQDNVNEIYEDYFEDW